MKLRLRLPTRFEQLIFAVVLITSCGIGMLASNVGNIRAALPLDTLYSERDLTTLLYDVARLESALMQVQLDDSAASRQELGFAFDLLQVRLGDRDGLVTSSPVAGFQRASEKMDELAAAVAALLRKPEPADIELQAAYRRASEVRRLLRGLNDSGFQAAMVQISQQHVAIAHLQRSATLVIAVLGAFGLGLIALMARQRQVLRKNAAAEREIRSLAFYDPLTTLPNRRLMVERLQHALVSHARQGSHGALLFIDLDNFKTLNDTHGHHIGDRLLRQVGARLQASVRESDTVARLGGDEFVVILENLGRDVDTAAAVAERIGSKLLRVLSEAYHIVDDETHSTPSIGVTLFGHGDVQVDELLSRADLAMYKAKEVGRNTLRFYDPEMQRKVRAQSALESDMRRALRDGQFELHYQGQYDHRRQLVGIEALLRWNHPEQGWISPADFIPLAERTGLILPLGTWVLRTACQQLARWQQDPAVRAQPLSVNVSARQFRHAGFVAEVRSALKDSGAAPDLLLIELTESLLLDDVEEAITRMDELRALGVRFALDDFGTGYSSLSYLKRLPLSQLKIDKSFVRDVLDDPNDAAIARTVIALGQSLGLDVLAEGVETREQLDFLLAAGCEIFQGYLFGSPRPAADLVAAAPANGDSGAPCVSWPTREGAARHASGPQPDSS